MFAERWFINNNADEKPLSDIVSAGRKIHNVYHYILFCISFSKRRYSKMRNRLAGPLLLFITLLLCIFIIECVARIVITEKVSYVVTFETRVDTPQRIRINDGAILYHIPFVEVYPLEKNKSSLRIIFLGDSVTAGDTAFEGLIDSKDRFTTLVEDWLNGHSEKSDQGVRYEVLNFGVSGYNLKQISEVFRESLQFAPDLIVYNYNSNDLENIKLHKREDGMMDVRSYNSFTLFPFSFPGNGILLSHSVGYKFLSHRLALLLHKAIPTFMPKSHDGSMGAGAAQAILRQMLDEAEERDIPFVIMIVPSFDGERVSGGIPPLILQAGYRSVFIWDVARNMNGSLAEGLRVSDIDAHPNKQGHAAIAEALKPYFEAYILNPDFDSWSS